ncbi:MAG TPA: hypothetical protein DD730_13480 [Desulfosporosinus sp.]|jgi:hypothetical protein|nr:hypothetical protein [Desulfosporosinus sp.]
MKKLLIVISFLFIGLLVGYSQGTFTKASPPPKTPEVVSPIVGTWNYYKDVPKMPSYATWTLTFGKDGIYTTAGDIITNGSKSHADTWGGKGTYTVTENRLTLTREDKGTTRIFNIEIKEENGQKQLIFKDDSKELSVASIGDGKTLYYIIFIKQN